MCFSLAQSAALCGLGVFTAIALRLTGSAAKYLVVTAYFAAMEVSALASMKYRYL
jgi:hypothetical protein